MLQVRDAVREVFRTQLAEASDETITEARRHLNRSYDQIVSRFGPLNAAQNLGAFANDPDQPLLLSLEEFNPETKLATKYDSIRILKVADFMAVARGRAVSESGVRSLQHSERAMIFQVSKRSENQASGWFRRNYQAVGRAEERDRAGTGSVAGSRRRIVGRLRASTRNRQRQTIPRAEGEIGGEKGGSESACS
jgi:hypothetical protein